MGKRKKSSAKPQGARKAKPLDTTFKCLFCKSTAVTCKIADGQANLNCSVCGQRFSSRANSLTMPIDCYSDWIDATEEVNAGA